MTYKNEMHKLKVQIKWNKAEPDLKGLGYNIYNLGFTLE